jgi:hypothetical protein
VAQESQSGLRCDVFDVFRLIWFWLLALVLDLLYYQIFSEIIVTSDWMVSDFEVLSHDSTGECQLFSSLCKTACRPETI